MKKTDIKGLGTALITPFKANGEVDYEALRRLVREQVEAEVDYIVVLGTTGEAVTLSGTEREQVRRTIVEEVDGKVALVLGVGGNCTANVIEELGKLNTELEEHYAAILSVCPYYNKPNQEGLYQHFCAIAKASPVPVVLYNVPGRTGVNLQPETIVRIADTCGAKIAGVKEASGNLEQIKHLIALRDEKQKDFLVISGDDGLTLEIMQAGGNGLISVASNAFPKDFRELVHSYQEKGEELQAKYAPIIRLLFKEGNPTGIKCLLSEQGKIENMLRLPLVKASEELRREMVDN